MPSIPEWVPLRMASASISAARSAAAVSVVKKGLPVPPARITTRPFSRWRMALRRMYGSATLGISSAVMTRVGWPMRSSASCSARPFITVAIMPIESAWAWSIPWPAPWRPRQKLPPPTTMARSTSNPRRASTTEDATWSRTADDRPNPPCSANASPDSFNTTRRHFDGAGPAPSCEALLTRALADLDLGVADDRGTVEQLADRHLVVLGVGLLEEADLLEVAVEPALHDLRERLLRLALVPRDGLERGPLLLHLVGRHLVPAQVAGAGEGHVDGDVVGQLRRAAGDLDEHGVHAAPALDVEVGVERVGRIGLHPHDLAELDVLLQGEAQVLDLLLAVGRRLDALRRDERGQGRDQVLEVLGRRDEVGLALELDDAADVAVDEQRHRALGVGAVGPLGRLRQALLPQPLGRGLEVAVVGLEGPLGVHHPGPGGLAQRLHVFGGERHRDHDSVASGVDSVGVAAGSAAVVGAASAAVT